MSHRSAMAASMLLVVYACLMAVAQLLDYTGGQYGDESIIGSFFKGKALKQTSDIVKRGGGMDRRLDLVLPENTRVFMTDMTGTNNCSRLGDYYFLTYYLFPREVAITLDEPLFTANGMQGHSTESDGEILANGFDVRVDITPERQTHARALRDVPRRTQTNPSWFGSWSDAVIAFLLPLLTALSGVWLLRAIFSTLSKGLPMLEKLACGLGLGMMAVAALTLGVKLCGFHGHGWVLALTSAAALAELWRDRKVFGNGIAGGLRKMISEPVMLLFVATGLALFLVLFRLAALQGIVEFDAVAIWLFKAKIFFLCTGHEIVGWFSNPRLAYAHMDYPTLVPSLHAATYDSIGHMDEFVTKFWPTWMLLFLLVALASWSRGKIAKFQAPLLFLLGVLLLPFTQTYVQMEGGTLPMVFFTVMGFVQCALGLAEKERARIGLGLTLLFGAAMTKFDGMIFLALTVGWILLLPSARQMVKLSPQVWRPLAFCFLAALPFICLRAQIPVLHPESGWAGCAMGHPGITFSSAPKIFLIMLARLFVNPDFAKWGAEDGQLHWTGHWDGLSSLYNPMTLGLAWVGLLLTIMLWAAAPARRPIILWTFAVYVSAMVVFSVVFASFVGINGLNDVIYARTADNEAGRYLFPMLLAWVSTMVIMFFVDFPMPVNGSDDQAEVTPDISRR